jgi:hypothetical protein
VRALSRNNIRLGKLRLEGIPQAPRGQPQIRVDFSVSVTGTVTARMSVVGSDLSVKENFEPSEELSDTFIAKMLAEAESTRSADEAELKRVEAVSRAKKLIAQAEEKLKLGPDARLSELIAELGLALASGDDGRIRERSDALAAVIAPMAFGGFDFSDLFGTSRVPARSGVVRKGAPVAPPAAEQRIATQIHPQVLGKIFGGTTFTLDTQLCFVLMPFDPKFQPLYDDHIKPAVERSALRCERADDIHGTSLITWDIWERINRARFLVAELTCQNPNVFYELGLAHALSKDVILITQSMDFVPFDLKTIRCIVYDFTPRGTQELEKALAKTIAAVMKAA